MKIDVHQHLWSEPFVHELSKRREPPFVRRERGQAILHLRGERPYEIDLQAEAPTRRARLVDHDGLDRALLCISSPLGIEALARERALALIDAYHEGALSLGAPFGVWGAVALDRADPADVDSALDRGCVGISLPAGALAGVEQLARLRPLLARLQQRDAPLLVHPGPGLGGAREHSRDGRLGDPSWWPALTHYVADMHAAWLAFFSAGRAQHPELRVIFSMLAALAPLHAERLASRGGPVASRPDPLVFYDTSSYGPDAVRMLSLRVGAGQLLYGSDRPVVEPGDTGMAQLLDWDSIADATARALGKVAVA